MKFTTSGSCSVQPLGCLSANYTTLKYRGPHIDLSLFMKEALEVWLNMVGIEHTWWHVSEAVEDSDMNALANRLRENTGAI